MAETLGGLGGLALKLGQLASYVDGLVPLEHQETYEQHLRSLRSRAPAMTADAAARVIRRELGREPEEAFQGFESVPFASASIGQVHRAAVAGVPVAVKVQHESIGRSVASDLDNASLLGALLGEWGAKLGVRGMLVEMRERFAQEMDYRAEADAQRFFGQMFAGDPSVAIPRVFDGHSAERVLTTGLAEGIGFEDACAASEPERRAWAETIWRFVFSCVLLAGRFNADPHPGNFLFQPNGRVWFLDFGCTRAHSLEKLRLVRDCHRAALGGDGRELNRSVAEMFELAAGSGLAMRASGFIRLCCQPILGGAPHRITRAYVRHLMQRMRGHIRATLGAPGAGNGIPREFLFFNRLQFGLYSVLARLDVDADYASVHARVLAALDGQEGS